MSFLDGLRLNYSQEIYRVVKQFLILEESERPDGREVRKLAWLFVNKYHVSRVDRSNVDVPVELRREIFKPRENFNNGNAGFN